jgi:hypothetical protein
MLKNTAMYMFFYRFILHCEGKIFVFFYFLIKKIPSYVVFLIEFFWGKFFGNFIFGHFLCPFLKKVNTLWQKLIKRDHN